MKRRKSREFSLQTISQQGGRGEHGKHSFLFNMRRELEGNEVGMAKNSLVKNQTARVKIQMYGPRDLGEITSLPHFRFLSLAHSDTIFPGGCCGDSMRCCLGGADHSAQHITRGSTSRPSITGEEDR